MKIGLFDPYLDTLGGGEKYILTAASCLQQEHEVVVFWDDASVLQRATERFNLNLERVRIQENIFSHKISFVNRLLITKDFDAIIFLSDGSIPLTFAKKLYIHFQFPTKWIKLDLLTKIKLIRVKEFICNSYFTKRYIDKKFNVTSVVLYPPADIQEEQIKKKENTILSVGRFGILPEGNNFKKQDFMIKTFIKMVDGGIKNWKLILVVSHRERDSDQIVQLEQLCKNYPIEIIKNATSNQLKKIYTSAKIYWHAAGFGENLDKHPERAEHFGISTVEAMARGAVPVVVNAGGQIEIVEDNINGFLWNSSEELIAQTISLIENNKLLEQVASAAIERAKMFSSERFCRELTKKLYE